MNLIGSGRAYNSTYMTEDRVRFREPRFAGRALGFCAALAGVLIPMSPVPATLAAPPAVEAQEAPSPPPEDSPKTPPAAADARKVFGKIRGAVYDSKKKPLAGMMVQLISKDEGGLLQVTGTDEKGQYLFQDLPPGAYDVEVGAEGYRQQRKGKILVRPPFRNIVDFQIEPLRPGEAAGSGSLLPGPPKRTASPETTGTGDRVAVRGRLLDQQKRPVQEASVTFIPLVGKGVYQASSGVDGTFSIDLVPAGRYRVRVVSPGHVALDLDSVEVQAPHGLDLRLLLVDYPLNIKGDQDTTLLPEQPQPIPSRPSSSQESAPRESPPPPRGIAEAASTKWQLRRRPAGRFAGWPHAGAVLYTTGEKHNVLSEVRTCLTGRR
jgi:protocatechuate 3,4-dioxygenase beta subunit